MSHSVLWQGRDDSSEKGDTTRLFQIVQCNQSYGQGDAVLAGFACHAGVKRNHGRIGAAEAPAEVRRKLASLPAHGLPVLFDAGDVVCEGDALEQAQAALVKKTAHILDTGARLVVVGGGHEIAWGDFQGLREHLFARDRHSESLLVLNFDAHFDLRTSRPGSSGTPFDQILEDSRERGLSVHYACFGVSSISNTPALYARAHELGVEYVEDTHMQERHLDARLEQLDKLVARFDHVYLTIDIDVLPAATAPGVSAPAPMGVPLNVIEACVKRVKRSGKIRLADMAEFNPTYDLDGRTARTVARLAWTLLQP